MSGRGAALALAAVVVVASLFAWRAWFGGEEAAVRARLESLAAKVNTDAGDGLGALAHAADLGGHFTADVMIDLGPGTAPIQGRTMLIGMATRLQPRLAAFRLVLDDIGVDLHENDSAADVRLTASFIERTAAGGTNAVDARELALTMTREDGTWRIARLATVETLR